MDVERGAATNNFTRVADAAEDGLVAIENNIEDNIEQLEDTAEKEIKKVESEMEDDAYQLYRALSNFRHNAKDEFKKSLAYTQKATLLKLLDECKQTGNSNGKGGFENKESFEEANKHLHEFRGSMIDTLANLAVLSALVGITTYSSVIKPMAPSTLDVPDPFSINGIRLTTILNMACTATAMLTICLATSYAYILNNLLIDIEDFIEFLLHVPVINQCLLFCILSVLFALLSLLISTYALYSSLTANICIITGTCILSSFFFIILPIMRKVFQQIDSRFQKASKNK